MRFDDDGRPLDQVGVHLTVDEARELAAELTRLIGEMEFPGYQHNLGGVGKLDLNIYPDRAQLEDGSADTVDSAAPDGE